GDEGKGRITDLLSQDADIVARFSGGHNAGHSLRVGDQRFELHLIPSGILSAGKLNVLTGGMVVSPQALCTEMEMLESRGLSLQNLYVSARAQVLFPHHALLDALEEARKAESSMSLGTTKKGIGPAYTDKVARRGVRCGDLLDMNILRARLEDQLSYTNLLLERVYGAEPVVLEQVLAELEPFRKRLLPMIVDVERELGASIRDGKSVVFEGAQGVLLDLDAGTYPYVTSSYPTAAGACLGSGLAPYQCTRVVGVAKAYVTRVGEGPFPTECMDNVGETLRTVGHEFGVTTGRARRCGWLDIPLLRMAVQMGGCTELVLTKLDVLSGFSELQVCTGYRVKKGEVCMWPPASTSAWSEIEPVYETFAGWKESIQEVRCFEDLPIAAQEYVKQIETWVGTPVSLVSVGPERSQAIHRAGAVSS
ncbi:MAG: adenylosuccinate synthase, partial [Myxococcota bacterium]